jgi:hypothetical protein
LLWNLGCWGRGISGNSRIAFVLGGLVVLENRSSNSSIVEVAWMALLARNLTEQECASREVTGASGGDWVGGGPGEVGGRSSRCQSLPVVEERCP